MLAKYNDDDRIKIVDVGYGKKAFGVKNLIIKNILIICGKSPEPFLLF